MKDYKKIVVNIDTSETLEFDINKGESIDYCLHKVIAERKVTAENLEYDPNGYVGYLSQGCYYCNGLNVNCDKFTKIYKK